METLTTETGLAILDKREAGLKALKEEYEGLTISGIDDREGYKRVSEARKILKGERVGITKDAKQLRDGANKFCSTVIARERELIKIIEPLEEKLYDQEKAIDDEKERLEAEAEKKEADRVQDRVNQLAKFNQAIDFFEAKNISDEAFNELLNQARIDDAQEQEKKQLEAKRLEDERIEQERLGKIEAERIANERAELEKQRLAQEKREAELKAEQAKVKAEQEAKEKEIRLAQEKLEADKKAHEEKLRKEQEEKDRIARDEQVRIETEARIKRESEEKAAREKAEAERKAALAPDKEKLLDYSKSLRQFIVDHQPSIASDEAKAVVQAAEKRLNEICNYIELTCKKL